MFPQRNMKRPSGLTCRFGSFALCVVVSLIALSTASCAVFRTGGSFASAGSSAAAEDEALVAIDLVSVMMQLPPLSPFQSTLQFAAPRTAYGRALLDAVESSGYGVQRVSSDQGNRYVSYGTRRVEVDDEPQVIYFLRVAKTNIERHYARRGRRLIPISPVYVIGAVPVPIVVNDELHRARVGDNSAFPSGVVFKEANGEIIASRKHIIQTGTGSARALGENVTAQRVLVLARASLFQNDRIHQAPDAHEGKRRALWQVSLTFDSPTSLHLGAGNKRALGRLRSRIDASTDRLAISGCSHGKSLLWDGTESEALARSQRIKEELLLAGVPTHAIHEEGCFDPLYGDSLEPNTVNVTLERVVGNQFQAHRSINRSKEG